MELKEFIEDTLMQIVQGVKSAQDKALEYNAIISPAESTHETVRINNKNRSVEMVDFEVILSETQTDKGEGRVSVNLMKLFKADIGGNDNKENGTRTNIKFRVPIILPGHDNGNTPTTYKRSEASGDGLSTF